MHPKLPVLLLAALLLVPAAARSDPGPLAGMVLTTAGRPVRALRAADLAGDAGLEILAFTDGEGGPGVEVFSPDESGNYPERPSATLRTAELGLGAVHYAAVFRPAAGRPAEILFADRDAGLVAAGIARVGEGLTVTTRRLGDAPPLPFPPDGKRLPVLDLAADLDGDGADELVLPTAAGYRIVRGGGSPLDLEIPPALSAEEVPHRSAHLAWDLPILLPADWDGDGRLDLVGGHRGRIFLFLQTEDGGFFPVAERAGVLDDDPGEVRTLVPGDVDGDGRLDLVVARTPARLDPMDRFQTRYSLHRGPRILSPGAEDGLGTPAATFTVNGAGVNPTLFDYDGDGDLDLLVTSLGITPGAKLRRQVDAEYRLFRYIRGRARFEEDASFVTTRPFPSEALERGDLGPVCLFAGDFDGDGLKDLVDTAGEGGVTIHAGTTDTGFLSSALYAFSDEPMLAARMGPVDAFLVVRLRGRPGDDLVLASGDGILVVRRRR